MKKIFIFLIIFVSIMAINAQAVWNQSLIISNNTSKYLSGLVSSDNGIFYSYIETRNNKYYIFLQQLNNEGINVWQNPICLDSCFTKIQNTKILKTSDNNYFILWTEEETNTHDNIYCLKFQSDGTLLTPLKILISDTPLKHYQLNTSIDSNGGFYLAFKKSINEVPGEMQQGEIRLRHILADGQNDWNNEDVILSSLDNVNICKVVVDSENNLYTIYRTNLPNSELSNINLVKTNQSGIIIFNNVLDSCMVTSNSYIIKNNLVGLSFIKLSDDSFIIAFPISEGLTVMAINNNGSMAWDRVFNTSYPVSVDLCPIDTTKFAMIYRDTEENNLTIIDIDSNILSTHYFSVDYPSSNLYYLATSSLNKIFIKSERIILSDPEYLPIIDHFLLTFDTNTEVLTQLHYNTTYENVYEGINNEIFADNRFFSILSNDYSNDYNLSVINLNTNQSINVENPLIHSEFYALNRYISTDFMGKNLINCFGSNHFFLYDSQGNKETFCESSSNKLIKSLEKIDQNNIILTYQDCFMDIFSIRGFELLNQNDLIYSCNVFGNSVSVYSNGNSCWVALQGSDTLDDYPENNNQINLYKIQDSNVTSFPNLLTASHLIAIKEHCLFIYHNNALRILSFNDNGELNPLWNNLGTILSTNITSIDNSKIIDAVNTNYGLLVIWMEQQSSRQVIKANLLDLQNGTLLWNTNQTLFQANNGYEVKYVKKNNKLFFVYKWDNQLKGFSYSINPDNLSINWESLLTQSELSSFDMNVFENKLLIAYAVKENNAEQVYLKTLSFNGASDQYPNGYSLGEPSLGITDAVMLVRIVKADDNHAYINWNEKNLTLLSQYINTADFLDSEDIVIYNHNLTFNRNYPNPFNPETCIEFSLNNNENVEVSVYNLKGQKVKTLSHCVLDKGVNRLNWNGKDDNGKSVATGLYFCRIKTKSKQIIHKMTLIK